MKNIFLATAVLVVALAGGFVMQQLVSSDPSPTAAAAISSAKDAEALQASAAPIDFELPDLKGDVRRLSEWQGKARLVNFWATWCAPCRREIPLLKALQDDYDNQQLQVIGIAVDFTEDVLAYAEEAQFNYPVLVGQEDAMAAAEMSGVDFIGLPFTMLFDEAGNLINVHMGEIKSEHIEEMVSVMAHLRDGDIDLASARERLHGL